MTQTKTKELWMEEILKKESQYEKQLRQIDAELNVAGGTQPPFNSIFEQLLEKRENTVIGLGEIFQAKRRIKKMK